MNSNSKKWYEAGGFANPWLCDAMIIATGLTLVGGLVGHLLGLL